MYAEIGILEADKENIQTKQAKMVVNESIGNLITSHETRNKRMNKCQRATNKY